MYGEVHQNRVLYNTRRKPRRGDKFRQIVVVELESFEVRVLDGEVLEGDPHFDANNPDALAVLHPNLNSACQDADQEYNKSVAAGWVPYA